MQPINERDHPPIADLDSEQELQMALGRLAGGALSTQAVGWGGTPYLPRSWLIQIHSRIRGFQGDNLHANRLPNSASDTQCLVAIGNRIDADIGRLLEADPGMEMKLLYGALLDELQVLNRSER